MSGHLVRGAGGGGKGGGGSQRVAQEDPDSLRSRQYARVLDAICEGEIVGLVDGAKSVYLDDTPLQNADGSYNFQNVVLNTTTGTQSQGYLPGYSDVESEIAVSVEVKASASVTRSITNTNINRARITVGVPQLTSQDTTNGDLHGTEVSLSIQLQVYVNGVGGGFSTVLTDTIRGKTTTKYQRAFNVNLTKPANCTGWDIRVVRTTPDSASAALVNKTWWDSYTEIIDVKLGYPNTALVGISIDASQFRAIPRRSYDVKLLKIKVPVNYDPVTRVYSGVWNGTFKTAWSDNPAWCFYDMLTNARYGLGEFISAAQVDKWTLYNIAQYCDELVPNGFGGTEPRFTCNLYLQTREEAYKVINDMASIFRAMVYWASGSIFASQDRPSDPVALFTPANVIDGMFNYEGSSRRSRYTVALVSWNDPADRYRQKIEYVEDADGIARYGIVQTEVASFGCNSRGQAHRQGKWILLSGSVETETVTFDIGLFDVRKIFPGAVIKVADAARAGKRWGGRIMAATTGAITLDALTDGSANSITIEAAKAYTLSVVLPDGTVASSTVTNAPGSNVTVLTVSPAYSAVPQQHAIWVLEESSLVAQTVRVIQITETAKATAKIVALEHNPSKFAAVEQGLALQSLPVTLINPAYQAPPTNLAFSENLYKAKGSLKTRLTVRWDAAFGAVRYQVETRYSNGNWMTYPEVNGQLFELPDVDPGVYAARVTSINSLGLRSIPAQLSDTLILGKMARPEHVTNFVVARAGKELNFEWGQVGDVDLDYYEIRWGTTWETAIPLHRTADNKVTVTTHQSGTFLIKAVDTSGNESATATAIVASDLTGINVLLAYEEGNKYAVNLPHAGGGRIESTTLGWNPAAKTIEMWVKPDWTITNLDYQVYPLFNNAPIDVDGAPQSVVLYVQQLPPPDASQLIFKVNDDAGIDYTVAVTVSSADFSQAVWTHIVATYSAAGMAVYINGVSRGTYGAMTPPTANLNAVARFGWGKITLSSGGTLDDIRVYNRAISSAEAAARYIGTYSDETGIVGFWPMNEGSGTTAYDYSGQGNHAVLTGTAWASPGKDIAWLGTLTNMTNDGFGVKVNAGQSSGTYETEIFDLGGIIKANVEILAVIEQLAISNTWSAYTRPWLDYTEAWQSGPAAISSEYYIRVKNTLGGAWGAWALFTPGEKTARYIQIKAVVSTNDLNYTGRIIGLKVIVDAEDRAKHLEDQSIASGGTTVTVSPAFVNLQTAQITLQNAAIGDTYRVIKSATNDGATIYVYSSAGVAKAGLVDVDFFGYGEKF